MLLSQFFCQHLMHNIFFSASLHLCSPLFSFNRPFVKLKECGSGRPNISRSSSSTSSFSSTTGETEALEELETVSAALTACLNKVNEEKKMCNKVTHFI